MSRHMIRVCGWVGLPGCVLALTLLACGGRQVSQGPHPVAPEKPLRIVSLSPELSRLIVDFGLASQIVGADTASHALPLLASTPDLGALQAVDAASVVALQPSLVFALGDEIQNSFAVDLRKRGIPVHVFDPRSANEVVWTIHELGVALDREAQASAAVNRLIQQISRIATQRDGKKRLRVAWIVERDPLTVVGDRGMLHQLLELAGGEIAFHRISGESVAVSFEALAANEPDLILDSTPESRTEPIAIGVRTEVLPISISELPTLDLLGRIRTIYAHLYPTE